MLRFLLLSVMSPFVLGITLAACDGGREEAPETLLVTDGACGDVAFDQKVGADSTAALAWVQAQKDEQFGAGRAALELDRLQVEGADGREPGATFYAVRVLDAVTGLLLHSVTEVVTTEGEVYYLAWCPD